MPSIRDSWSDKFGQERLKPERYEMPEPVKKGIMCTRCHHVQWGAGVTVSNARCGKCGNTAAAEFINVTSADFNKYTGRYIGGERS